MELNERIADIPASQTLAISAKAKEYKAAGEDVCSFGAGEPDFDTPPHIKAAAEQALKEGQTKYSPAVGLPALRAAIAEKLNRENALAYTEQNVIVNNGAKHSLFNVFMAICRAGDEVIVPQPYWLSYPEMVRVAGGTPVFAETSEHDGYRMTPDQLAALITPKSRAVILNSPSNPTGVVYEPDELRALAETAVKHDLFVVADEIYEKILYDDVKHASAGSFSDEIFRKTITVNGFSKAFAMTGWRLGYLAAPPELVKAISALQSHSTSGPNTFAQYGALAALTGPDACVAEMVAEFRKRRDYLYERLSSVPGVTCVKPRGAFYMLPNISASGLNSLAFAERLLAEKKVAVVPGSAFGAEGTVRFSYACSMENIEKGLDRVAAFMSALAR